MNKRIAYALAIIAGAMIGLKAYADITCVLPGNGEPFTGCGLTCTCEGETATVIVTCPPDHPCCQATGEDAGNGCNISATCHPKVGDHCEAH